MTNVDEIFDTELKFSGIEVEFLGYFKDIKIHRNDEKYPLTIWWIKNGKWALEYEEFSHSLYYNYDNVPHIATQYEIEFKESLKSILKLKYNIYVSVVYWATHNKPSVEEYFNQKC